MKTRIQMMCVLALLGIFARPACAQNVTAFTYQGRLNINTNVANGSYDLRFALYSALNGGQIIAGPVTNSSIPVTNGMFTTILDFGGTNYPGANRWLDISARTNGTAAFTSLSPRQMLTATPYAVSAVNFNGSLAGDVTGAQPATTVSKLQGVPVSSTAPIINQLLRATGTNWSPSLVALATDVSGTLATARGGTGLSNFVAGDTLYAPAVNVLGRLPIGTINQVLTVNSNGLPAWLAPTNHNHFGQDWFGTATDGLFVQNASPNAGSSGFTAILTDPSALNVAVFGESQSVNGIGVQGTTLATGTNAAGVIGSAVANSGYTVGVYGQSQSPNGTGVYGFCSSLTGGTIGVFGECDSTNGGAGLWGLSTSLGGNPAVANPVGVYGEADGQFGSGVFGNGKATNGVPVGVYGAVGSRNGWGFYTTNRTWTGGQLTVANGSSNAPAIVFANSLTNVIFTTGIYSPATNAIGFSILGTNRVVINTNGNVGIGTLNPTNTLHVVGGVSATAFVTTSDRNAKENFAPVSPQEILAKVAALPISTWTFKQMPGATHLGPTAQDFYAAFGLGGSETTITTVDPDGVALAAIQGLNEKLRQKDSEIEELKKQTSALEARLRRLEAGR